MKRIIIAAVAALAASSAAYAQTWAMEKYAATLIEGRPFFTDAENYNSYDLFGSQIGRFETGATSRIGAESEYRYYGLGDEAGHYLSGQTFRFGEPGRTFFEVSYGPDIMSRKDPSANNGASLLLHRAGLAIATQSTSGSIRSAFSAKGYIGNQKWDGNDYFRWLPGIEKVRLDVGSQPHPLFRIGFYAGLSAQFDSLSSAPPREERLFQMNLPEFGANVDFGGDGVPIRSNMAFSYAWSRFVYKSWPVTAVGGVPSLDGNGHSNAIANDSLRFMWLAHAKIPLLEDVTLRPGLLFGFSNNSGRERVPADDGYPFNIGGEVSGYDYGLRGIHFGAGTGVGILNYADIYAEHSFAAMSLTLGDAYRARSPSFTGSRPLHRTAFGVSTSVHKYLELPFEITPRVAYFISGATGVAGSVHSSIDPMNVTFTGISASGHYRPEDFLATFTRLNGFTFGVDGRALVDNMLSASFWMTFLSRKNGTDKDGGMELGISVGLSM